MSVSIEPMTVEHWPSVRDVYLEGIATGNATFQSKAPTWDAFDIGHLQSCRIVALEDDRVIGWAALSAVSSRSVYSGVCEVSVYVAQEARGRGVGRVLLHALIAESEVDGRWTLQAGIFPENEVSVALHLHAGFRTVGRRERIGALNGVWRDVLLLERRSRRDSPGHESQDR